MQKIHFFFVSRYRSLKPYVFFNENLLFCNLIEAFFSSLELNFMHDGIVLCLSHLFASLKWRLWSLK